MKYIWRDLLAFLRGLGPWALALALGLLGLGWALSALFAGAPAARVAPHTTAGVLQPTPPAISGPTPSVVAPSGSLAAVIREVVALTNQARQDNGCSIMLTSNPLLDQAAQGHSEDMAQRGYFDHITPDGRDPGDRMTATGYHWASYGENIAAGYASPAQVVEGWMNSPGHRANILNCAFHEIGVGYIEQPGTASSYRTLWTQVFATSQ